MRFAIRFSNQSDVWRPDRQLTVIGKLGRTRDRPPSPHKGILAHNRDHRTLRQESLQPLPRTSARQTSAVSASVPLLHQQEQIQCLLAVACASACACSIATAWATVYVYASSNPASTAPHAVKAVKGILNCVSLEKGNHLLKRTWTSWGESEFSSWRVYGRIMSKQIGLPSSFHPHELPGDRKLHAHQCRQEHK